MDGLQLHPHPDFPSVAVTAITVYAGRRQGGQLVLRFDVTGDLDNVIWPEVNHAAGRADGLWQHSCFEAFVSFAGEAGYCEFNASPTSAKWAAYRFDGYRAGMRELEDVINYGHASLPASHVETVFTSPDLDRPVEWRFGVSAIIEAKDGSKSYWALKHPPGKPDFHNPDCFIATLPAPAAP